MFCQSCFRPVAQLSPKNGIDLWAPAMLHQDLFGSPQMKNRFEAARFWHQLVTRTSYHSEKWRMPFRKWLMNVDDHSCLSLFIPLFPLKKLSSEDCIIQLAIGRRIQIANLQKKFENDR